MILTHNFTTQSFIASSSFKNINSVYVEYNKMAMEAQQAFTIKFKQLEKIVKVCGAGGLLAEQALTEIFTGRNLNSMLIKNEI